MSSPATVPFARAALATPALVVDLAALDRNIGAMQRFASDRGLLLRPHAKTHKSVDIARRQIAAGAVGICCAKLGEAEALAAGGIADIHLTSPVVTKQAIERLLTLSADIALSVVVDHPDNVAALDAAAAAGGRDLNVVLDIDPGIHRTGVASPEAAVLLAERIATSRSLHCDSVQYYCGAQQHLPVYADRHAAIVERTDYLRTVLSALAKAGHKSVRVTGGGTGTFAIDAELGTMTELQVGSYIFLDRQYDDCDLAGGGAPTFECSLSVDATVISANAAQLVTIDAGFKAFSSDAGPPTILEGAGEGAFYAFMGDEHGAVVVPGGPLPELGERLTLLTPHCDPTVNLYDEYHVAMRGRIVAIWPVSARGCST